MRKVVSIFFVMSYILSTTSFVEVLKVPILVDHYLEHDEGFLDFMVHHYGGHEKDADWDRDMQLPFMTGSTLMIFAFNIPVSNKAPNPVSSPLDPDSRRIMDDSHFSSNYLADVFQPPKSC